MPALNIKVNTPLWNIGGTAFFSAITWQAPRLCNSTKFMIIIPIFTAEKIRLRGIKLASIMEDSLQSQLFLIPKTIREPRSKSYSVQEDSIQGGESNRKDQ